MLNKISIIFYIKEVKKIKGRYRVNCRIYHSQKKSEIVTDIYTTIDKWNKEIGRPKNDPETSARIAIIESNIYKVKEQLVMEGYEISSKLIKEIYTGAGKVKYGVVEYIQRFIENKEKDTTLSKTYFFKFRRLKKLIGEFISKKYHVSDLMLSSNNFPINI